MKTLFKLFILIISITFVTSCKKRVVTCFEFSSTSFDTITPIFFNAECSQGVDSYWWYFGDGASNGLYGDTVSHRYSKPGTYTIKLRGEKSERLDGGPAKGSIMEMEKTIIIK